MPTKVEAPPKVLLFVHEARAILEFVDASYRVMTKEQQTAVRLLRNQVESIEKGK